MASNLKALICQHSGTGFFIQHWAFFMKVFFQRIKFLHFFITSSSMPPNVPEAPTYYKNVFDLSSYCHWKNWNQGWIFTELKGQIPVRSFPTSRYHSLRVLFFISNCQAGPFLCNCSPFLRPLLLYLPGHIKHPVIVCFANLDYAKWPFGV